MQPRTSAFPSARYLPPRRPLSCHITPDLAFEVSGRIREEFDNGRLYYDLHGRRIAAPENPLRRPDLAALAWHNETVFRG